jgi:hypothetical protein
MTGNKKKILLFPIMILERLNKFIRKLLPKKKAVDPYYECYPNHLPRLIKELNESDCTCTNCIFIDGGRRYCYDCEKYTKMPPKEELERKIEEFAKDFEN